MRKLFTTFLIIVFAVSIVGCGGSKNKGSNYTYKWSPGGGGVTASKFVAADVGEEPPAYSGASVPPFASVDALGATVGHVAIYTYFDGVPVRSNYTVDPSDGAMDVTGVGGVIDIFRPIRTGILNVTATYNGEALTIPVHTYYAYTFDGLTYLDFDTMTVYPDGSNPAVDVLFYDANFKAPYGYITVPDTVISSVMSAPSGLYRELGFGQEYWAGYYDDVVSGVTFIKTSENRFVKLSFISWGSGATFCFWVSDENGVFSH